MAKKTNEKGGAPKGKGKERGKEKEADSPTGSKAKSAQSINVRHILCEKHSKKEEALSKIRGGSKFDEVARDMSEDKARQGGSLGWKTRGSMDPDFEKVAFELESSSTGSPKIGEVKTQHGYHIIMVEGRK